MYQEVEVRTNLTGEKSKMKLKTFHETYLNEISYNK